MTEIPRGAPEFIDWLSARHAWIAVLAKEHADYYDELLPHVLFGDVTRHAADLARRSRVDHTAADELGAFLGDLDVALSDKPADAHDDVDNLILASFVENAPPKPRDGYDDLWERLRAYPRLARATALR